MLLHELRERHPRFIYRSYHVSRSRDVLNIRFEFLLEPNIRFNPEVVLPINESQPAEELDKMIFHLGLVEAISYWKCACSPEFIIEAGSLGRSELTWWHDLFIHGMGEFYYRNSIDFGMPNFLRITAKEPDSSEAQVPLAGIRGEGDLILVGGGKDSSLTLEILRDQPGRRTAMALNPTRSALDSARIAGYTNPVIIRRTLDPALLALNKEGYLNGHTPFSAYLAFLGVLAAAAGGYENVITSNEAGANEPNLYFRGLPVNHQYSKSLRFERLFREYVRLNLSEHINYFSFLRPLHDIQISRLFSRYPAQLRSFRSCNVNQKSDSWCGACPKCAFVYLSLAPFLTEPMLMEIFGANLFDKPAIQTYIRELCGLGERKPFECVGTIEECILAVHLLIEKRRSEGTVPPFFQALATELGLENEPSKVNLDLLNDWDEEHFLPLFYEERLAGEISDADESF